MMKMLRNLLASLMALLTLSACSSVEFDYYPVTMDVIVHDKDGNDLLDPDYEGNIIDETFISYQGEFYDLYGNRLEPETRAYLARWENPTVRTIVYKGDDNGRTYGHCIHLGEWNGDGKWDNESVWLHWPDGTVSVLSFTLKKAGVNHAKYFLDGKAHDGPLFRFVK